MPKKSAVKEKSKTFSGLEQIFGSKTRFVLLKLFCRNPEKEYFVRELARLLNNQLNSVRREAANLESVGIIREVATDDPKKKFYKLNTNFILINEISSLITKSELLAEKNLVSRIKEMGTIDLCILTGALLGVESPCDILLVGKVVREDLARLIKKFEIELDKPIAYTILSPEEYKQRKALTDKFLFSVLESKKMVPIDKYGEFAESDIL
jgi:hypothetical protein